MKEKKIVISNKIEELNTIVEGLEILADEWEIPMAISVNLNLVLEELITNIIFYGYDDQLTHEIEILFQLENNQLNLQITDDAREFNPLDAASPDMNLAIEDMKIGGLGIHLVKQIMDTIHYQRTDNRNILHLSKKIN